MTAPSPAEWPAVLALLRASGLPTSDLGDAHREHFRVARDVDGGLAGCVAVEPHGDAGLLRSLAVAAPARGTGLGTALVAEAEAVARATGLSGLYLLTATAAPFFEALGWRPMDRADVPAGVRASSEFGGTCCASAVCMGKTMGTAAAGAQNPGRAR